MHAAPEPFGSVPTIRQAHEAFRRAGLGDDQRAIAAAANLPPGASDAVLWEIARAAQLKLRTLKAALKLLTEAPALANRVLLGEMSLGAAIQANARARQYAGIAQAVLPSGTFRTIVADPAWRYQDTSCRGAAAKHYLTMSVEEICALPIGARAAKPAHLYLWVTAPMLSEGFKVLAAWGFRYITTLVWRKPGLGLGWYFRSQTEFVLFGVRGQLGLKARDIPNVFEAPLGRHSEKPEAFFDLVERASPGPYLELFARRTRPGWTSWGAEVDSEPAIIETAAEVKGQEGAQ